MPTLKNEPVLNQLAERELIKKFRHENTWLNAIRSKNNWVNNDVIKIPVQGAAPEVLINHTGDITSSKREDKTLVVSLEKFETKNTDVTDDELYALPYEKVSDVQVQHREELEDKSAEYALFNIAPDENKANMPVLKTTGADDGTGRKKLTTADLINLKKELDKLNVPKVGRMLILSPDHVADLLDEDRKFFAQYQNIKQGLISKNYCGFETYEANYAPTYKDVAGTLTKEAFGAVPTGKMASVVTHKRTTVKARGNVIRYMRTAATDPVSRKNTIGFRVYFTCVSYKEEGRAAIISGTV